MPRKGEKASTDYHKRKAKENSRRNKSFEVIKINPSEMVTLRIDERTVIEVKKSLTKEEREEVIRQFHESHALPANFSNTIRSVKVGRGR